METKPLAAGTVLRDRYRITRLVAGGGMAWVYEAEERRPDGSRQVWALKELRADADDTHTLDEGRRLFAQEANILVRLSHPNLPQVSAFFEERGRSYLVMEFIGGESLEKRLEQARAPMLESQVVDWALQVCEVLAYLHAQVPPVVFRDIKPSNVMVTPTGTVKLIDFGIARTYKAGQRRDTISMGSENYAAPEQWGKAQSDPRADIYGLGATMYHLLSNVPPLPAFVPKERVPLREYNPAVSEALAAVVETAMSPDREQRYPSAAAMREALLACLPRHQRRRYALRREAAQQPAAASAAPPPPIGEPAPAPPRPAQPAASNACRRCGRVPRPGARFCRACGQPLGAAPPPVLVVAQPVGAHWEYPLRGPSTLIGRRGGSLPVDLDLGYYDPEGYVSRNHARIEEAQHRYRLLDLHSANGTYVNDTLLVPGEPRALRHGDRIRVGKVELVFTVR